MLLPCKKGKKLRVFNQQEQKKQFETVNHPLISKRQLRCRTLLIYNLVQISTR